MDIPKRIIKKIQKSKKLDVFASEEEWIKLETDAYIELTGNFDENTIKISSNGSDSFQSQLKFLNQIKLGSDIVKKIKSPKYLNLLLEMEYLIGSSCNNKNTNTAFGNYRFRPTFTNDDGEYKCDTMGQCSSFTPISDIVSGKYKFGANQIAIFEALIKIIDLLESDYKLDLTKK